jgi:hypothetical protein
MKKLLILLSLVALLSSCHHGHRYHKWNTGKGEKESKEVIVPSAVKSAFEKQFAKAKNVEWSLEKTDEFEAEFIIGKAELSAVYDSKGTLLETGTPIVETELPQAVKDSLTREFAGYDLYKTEKIDTKGVISYEMKVKKTSTLSFDAKGKLIKNEVKKEKDNDIEYKGKKKESKEKED